MKAKRKVGRLVLGILVAALLALPTVTFAKQAVKQLNLNDKMLIKRYRPDLISVIKPCDGPDPAVLNAQVTKSVMGTGTQKKGVLTASAIIKNVGTKDFVSNPSQAAAMIQCHNPAISGPRGYETVRNIPIANLNKGASFPITGRCEIPFFIEWGHRTPHHGECQAEREVIIYLSYDPDIYLDGNPKNDDCRSSNNRVKKTYKFMVHCPW